MTKRPIGWASIRNCQITSAIFAKNGCNWNKSWYMMITSKAAWKVKSEKSERLVKCENFAVFFDYNSIVHHEFLPNVLTVNKEYYLEHLRHLKKDKENARICCNSAHSVYIRIMHLLTHRFCFWFFDQK